MEEFMPDTMVIYFKDSLSRTEVNTKMGAMVIIYNGRTGDYTTCMDMMGKKIAMKATSADMNSVKANMGMEKPQVKVTNETKIIAGFKCRKAILTQTLKGKEVESESWYTNDIAIATMDRDSWGGVDGYPLESVATKNGMSIKHTCKSFEKILVADSMFVVPQGYEEMDMGKMMNGIEH
jgi:hypothetical protein